MSLLNTAGPAAASVTGERDCIIDHSGPKQLAASRSVIRQLLKQKAISVAVFVLLGYSVLALLAPVFLQDGLKNNPKAALSGPSWAHPLGTDWLGRDQLSRIAYGIRTTALIALGSTAIPLVIGVSAGLLAGLSGRWVDSIAMRLVDVLFAFPALLIAMTVITILGPGMVNVMIAIGILFLPHMMRTARSPVLTLKEMDFVMVGRSYGASTWRLLRHHIFPNALPPIIVMTALILSRVIIVEATLSFLGLWRPTSYPNSGRYDHCFPEIHDFRSLVGDIPRSGHCRHGLLYQPYRGWTAGNVGSKAKEIKYRTVFSEGGIRWV